MYNLYKTELPKSNYIPNLKSTIPQTTRSKSKKIDLNTLLSRNDLNIKIKNTSVNRKLLNENYLDFMIQEKLNYADVEKIINHYSKKIDEHKQKYDANKNLLKKKKGRIKQFEYDTVYKPFATYKI